MDDSDYQFQIFNEIERELIELNTMNITLECLEKYEELIYSLDVDDYWREDLLIILDKYYWTCR